MDKRIYIQDWLALKPYQQQTPTDGYYLKLCNEVKQAIVSDKTAFVFLMYIDKKDIDFLSCFLCSWFEDVISQTNIYGSFISTHKKLYKKQLPFFDLEEYYEEEINIQDVKFLIWYFLNTVQTEKFIAPFNSFIDQAAERVFQVFDKAWEYAPENKRLKLAYSCNENETDFYVARNLIDTILFKTYLFHPDTLFRLLEQEGEIVETTRDKRNLIAYLNENRDSFLHTNHTRLLSLKGKEWAAEIIGKEHKLSSSYLNLTQKIRGYFFYKGQDEFNISLEHVASGKKFALTKKSFDYSSELKDIDTMLFMSIVQNKFNADLVLDERNSLKSRSAVDFLDYQSKETIEILELQQKAFLKYNNGSPIAFMPSSKIESYFKTFIQFYNQSLNLTEKESEETLKRVRKEGFFGNENDGFQKLSEYSDSGLVFFNPKSGVEIAFAVNSAFPLPSNPYFNEEESEDHIFRLLMDESISTELAMYCIDHCQTKLPFFQEGEGAKYLNDIDFLLRFWKK